MDCGGAAASRAGPGHVTRALALAHKPPTRLPVPSQLHPRALAPALMLCCAVCVVVVSASFTVFLERKIVKALHGKLHQGQIAGCNAAAAEEEDGW